MTRQNIKKVKAWAVIRDRELIDVHQDKEIIPLKFGSNRVEIVPCEISYSIPSKSKKK